MSNSLKLKNKNVISRIFAGKKNILFVASSVILFTGMTFVSSCGGSKDQPKNETTPIKSDSTKASAYICPMGDGQGDAPGKCPKCGMDMVKNEKALK